MAHLIGRIGGTMREIIQFIVFALLLFLATKLFIFIFKRTLLLCQIYSLKKMCGAKITLHSFPFRPMWMMPKGPDISVEILDTVYLLRLYSGGGDFSSVHFVNEKYSAVYIQVKGASRSHRAKINTPSLTGGINIGTKVYILPEFDVPTELRSRRGIDIVKVMLLNPAPSAMTYVTEEKTSIRVAFTGDEFYGMKVFTGSTFINHADRESRNPKKKKYPEFDYFEDFQ